MTQTDAERKRQRKRERAAAAAAALDRGEWLTTGEVAAVLDVGRSTVHRLQDAGAIGYRERPGTGPRRTRECDPVDVRAEKLRREEVHRQSSSRVDPPNTTFRLD